MTFTYTNPAGINKQVDLDIDALLEYRWNNWQRPLPTWAKVAKASGIASRTLTEIRKSPEWVVAVAEFLHGKDINPARDDLKVFGLELLDVMHMNAPSGLTLKVGAWSIGRWVTA